MGDRYVPGVTGRRQMEQWVEAGVVPDDHTTRQHAAQAVGQLLAALDEAWSLIDELVDDPDGALDMYRVTYE